MVEADLGDFSLELLGILNAAHLQGNLGVVEIGGADLALGHAVAVDEQAGLARPVDDGGHMLPLVDLDGAWGGGDGAVGLVIRSGGFDAEDSIGTGHVEIPAVGPVVFAEANDAGLTEFAGMDPGGDAEISLAHGHGFVAGDGEGILIAVEGQGLAEGGICPFGIGLEGANQMVGGGLRSWRSVEGPMADEFLV